MTPKPSASPRHPGAGRLAGKIALITGGDSGIGRAVAYAFAREGADVGIVYLDEHDDAKETAAGVEKEGRQAVTMALDVSDERRCQHAVSQMVESFGRIDVLVNNAAIQFPKNGLEEITAEQLERTFRTNIFSYFFMTREALRYMKAGGSIVNTTSVTAYRGSDQLLDYSATKGAIVAFTRSLAKALIPREIRVNAVAPGPVWTPLIAATFSPEQVAAFGKQAPMGRPGQPEEIAPSYVFLASEDASYMTGQVLHPNGGDIVNG